MMEKKKLSELLYKLYVIINLVEFFNLWNIVRTYEL